MADDEDILLSLELHNDWLKTSHNVTVRLPTWNRLRTYCTQRRSQYYLCTDS